MKTLNNYIKTGVTLIALLVSFQQTSIAQPEHKEWNEVKNLFTAAQELTLYQNRLSLLEEMADEADDIFQHETGMLLFISTMPDSDEMDMEEELLYGIHAFNGNRMSPVGEIFTLAKADGIGITYSGTIGGMPMLVDQVFMTDDTGNVMRILSVRADQIGKHALPECVSEWILCNFKKVVPALARCEGK